MDSIAINKREFLKLLEEDEEFRYAVAAKIGLLKIFEKLEQHDRKFNEILERLDRHEAEIKKIWEKLEQHDRKFNEILERLDRHEKILIRHGEEIKGIWGEIKKIWHEIRKIWEKLEQHDRKFDEIHEEIKRIWEELRRHREILDKHTSMLGALGSDIGALTEATLSRFVRDDLVDEIKLSGEKISMIRRMYMVDEYEVDLYIECERKIYVVEVKTRPGIKNIERLVRVRDYLMSKTEKSIEPILATLRAKTTLDIVSESRKQGIRLIVY